MKTQPKGPFLFWGKLMKSGLCFKVRLLSLVGGIKIAKMRFFSICNYSGAKFIFTRSPLNAEYPRFVVFMRSALVVKVLTHRCFAKIGNSIIGRIAIYMVDQLLWKLTVYIKPHKAMGLISRISDDYMAPSFAAACPSYISGSCPSAGNKPRKYASFSIVVKKFAQTICSQIFFYNSRSHDDSNKVGSVRASVAVQTPHWLVQFTGVYL